MTEQTLDGTSGPEPDPTATSFRPADLTAFQQGGLLWAVNQYVLWPLGLALTMVVDFDQEGEGPVVRGPIEIREWVAPDGHVETIEDDSEQPDFDRYEAFVHFVEDRIPKMPLAESDAALRRLALLGINNRPRWKWVDEA